MTTVVATPGQGPDRPQEVSYTDIKVSKEEGQLYHHVCHSNLLSPHRAQWPQYIRLESTRMLINTRGSVIIQPGDEIYGSLYSLLSVSSGNVT